MLNPIPDLPDGVIGFRLAGRLSAEDYRERLVPDAEAELERHGRLRLLVVIDRGIEGIDAGAIWQDTLFGLRHFRDFERIAFVSDRAGIAEAAGCLDRMMPGEIRGFSLADMGAARDWLAANAQG